MADDNRTRQKGNINGSKESPQSGSKMLWWKIAEGRDVIAERAVVICLMAETMVETAD